MNAVSQQVAKKEKSASGSAVQRVSQGRAVSNSFVDNSPFIKAQRQQLSSAFGSAIQPKPKEKPKQLMVSEAVFQPRGKEEKPKQLMADMETLQAKSKEKPKQLQTSERALQAKAKEKPKQLMAASGVLQAQGEQMGSPRVNNTGLPDQLKSGVESLSGMSMDAVRVHYNSGKPAQLNALAYAQGSDIHVAPGQEQHLPHEAWHVVQQAQGRVEPTMQMQGGAPVNDDKGLEHEADVMGAKAARGEIPVASIGVAQADITQNGSVIQRARGGIEYTEGGTTTLMSHYPGGGAPGGTAPVANQLFGATLIEGYQVPNAQIPAWTGNAQNTDHTLLQNNRLKLTNDVLSAEWVIEGHAAGGLTARQLVRQVLGDVAQLFLFRRALRAFINANSIPLNTTVLAPDGTGDLSVPGPQGLFVYSPDDVSTGKVQITAQYENVDTIRRINELNASKYLTGTKVAEGRDADRVAGTPSLSEQWADYWQTSSSATAAALYADLLGLSVPLAGGGANLTAAQSALVKLMVVNDAMASNMSRHAAIIGQAQEKNIQRFFPKAERQTYTEAVARGAIPPLLLAALRLDIVANRLAMGQAVWNRADPFALSLTESTRARTQIDVAAAIAAPLTDANAAAAAPLVAGGQVTAALATVGPAIANELARGMTPQVMLPLVAQVIISGGHAADPDATAIAQVAVNAAVAARDNVTVAMLPLLAAQRENAAGRATTQGDKDNIKNLVLGANGGLLAAWIGRAALAYTDSSGAATDHVDAGTGTGNVISSTQGYTPVAGGGQGAVYEFREREVNLSEGDTAALKHALSKLFGAAD